MIEKRNEQILKEILECSVSHLKRQSESKAIRMGDWRAGTVNRPHLASDDTDDSFDSHEDDHAATAAGVDPAFAAMQVVRQQHQQSDTEELQLARVYSACMDTPHRDERGAVPLEPILARIDDEVHDAESAIRLAGELARDYLISFFFGMGVRENSSAQ